MREYKDIHGRTIEIGDIVRYTLNTTMLSEHENFTAEVKYLPDFDCLGTDSPYKEAQRPFTKNKLDVEIVKKKDES